MTDYIKHLAGGVYHDEATRLIQNASIDTTVTDGVIRWDSNDRVPPQDILDLLHHVGFAFDIEASQAAAKIDLDRTLDLYRQSMANRSPEQIAEQRMEARAAHGPGVVLQDVITGETWTT